MDGSQLQEISRTESLLLLGICFLRGVPEEVVGEVGEGEKGG
jgi:hypothetical protein